MNKFFSHNQIAEETVLQYIAQMRDNVLLATLNMDWLTGHNQNLLVVFRTKKENLEYFYCTKFIQDNSIDVPINLVHVVFKGEIRGDLKSCLIILEEEYLRRELGDVAYKILGHLDRHTSPFKISLDINLKMRKIHSISEGIEKFRDNEEDETWDLIDFGNPMLDSLMLSRQQLMLLAGDRGNLKTNYILELLSSALIQNVTVLGNENFKVGLFSKEMSFRDIKYRMFAKLFRIPFAKVKRGQYDKKEIGRLFDEKYGYFNDNFLVIKSEQINNIDDVPKFITQEKLTLWGFDYLQLMARSMLQRGEDVHDKIAWTVTNFKNVVNYTNTMGIAVSTLTKKDKFRTSTVPRLEDLYSSVELQYLATWIGLCYWPWFFNRTLNKQMFFVLWEKNRNEEPFTMPIKAFPEHCTFEKFNPTEIAYMQKNNSLGKYLI